MAARTAPTIATKVRVFITWPVFYGAVWWLTLSTMANQYDSYEGGPQAFFWGFVMVVYGVLFYLLVGLPLFAAHLLSSGLRYFPIVTTGIYIALSYFWFREFVVFLCVPLSVIVVWEVFFGSGPVRWAHGKAGRFWKYCTTPSEPRW